MTNPVKTQFHGQSFARRFWPLFALGAAGVATLPLILVPAIRSGALPPGTPDLPLPALVALSMVNPLLLLAATVAVGAWAAPKLGLTSLVADFAQTRTGIWPRFRASVPIAIGVGLAAAALVFLLEPVFQPFLSADWREAAHRIPGPGTAAALISGLGYGGITEEIMLRWGVLSFLAWAGWRVVQRGKGDPSPSVMWSAIILAALLFGLGHLPMAATLGPLDTPLVLRVVTLNGVAGVLFGWLFWRRHLEAAMLAHASAHIGFALFAWSGAYEPV